MKPKSKRPISRNLWPFLRFIPGPIRKEFARSRFEVSNELPENIVFKQAETEDEIFQAMNIVYESFVELDCIDKNSSRVRFNKYLALPHTVILIAKQNETVLGTISIIPDSAFGLPTETTWSIDKLRKSGKLLAEISSLEIRKDFKMRRGRLLFHLCKIMFLYSKHLLNLDGIVTATTLEVEPFYTDLLLFEKIGNQTGPRHSSIKGNPSTCCYLDLSKAETDYKKIYGERRDKQNLYKFFVETIDPRIRIPNKKLSILGYTREKNLVQKEMFNKYKELHDELTLDEKQILSYSDQYNLFSDALSIDVIRPPRYEIPIRSEIRSIGWIFSPQLKDPLRCKVINISERGLKLISDSDMSSLSLLSKISVAVQIDKITILCRSEIVWMNEGYSLGAKITEPPQEWKSIIQKIEAEILEENLHSAKRNTSRQAS